MASENEPGQELHDTTGAAAPSEDTLPPAILNNLPERFQEQAQQGELEMAEDWMQGTVQNSDTEQVTLVDEQDGSVYVLEMQDITWQQTNQALTDALVPDASGQGGKLDFGAFYRSVAEDKIVGVQPEVPEEQMATWLTGLNERLGKQLQQHLPDPVDNIDEQREGN